MQATLAQPVLGLLLLGATTAAQLPPGWSARVGYDVTGGGATVELVDAGSGVTSGPISGLSAYVQRGFVDVVFDPYSGELYVGARNPSIGCGCPPAGQIVGFGLSGTSAFGVRVVADLNPPGPPPAELENLALGPGGDLFATHLFDRFVKRVDRRTGSVSTWWGTPGVDERARALAIDQDDGRLWIIVTPDSAPGGGQLLEFDLALGVGSRTLLVDFGSSPYGWNFFGMDYDPAGALYLRGYSGFALNVLRYDLASGAATVVPGVPFVNTWMGTDFDRVNGRLHMTEDFGGNADYHVLAPATGTLATHVGIGSVTWPVALDVNDWLDRTTVFPRFPSVALGFTLEAAAHGRPGDLAGVALTAVNGVPLTNPPVLGLATVDANGIGALPPVVIPPGALPPGLAFTFVSARLEVAPGRLVWGTSVDLLTKP